MPSCYMLELDKWNVKNDGTDAINTSKGLNSAFIWASEQGITELTLPKGMYLIDESNPIQPQSNMTFNLGGSTLRIRDNGLRSYAIVSFRNNQQYSRITNGKIEGDRYTHNYSSGGTHEGGYGIELGSFISIQNGGNNSKFITLDNLEIYNCTGDAITINSTFGQILPSPTGLANSWEKGGINTSNGSLDTNPNKIRSTIKIDLKQPSIEKYGYFGLYGNGYGNLGSDIITDFYDVFFYKDNDLYISSMSQVQFFDEIEIPTGSIYAKVVLHQSLLPSAKNTLINVRVPSFPQYIFIEKCNIFSCRRQGITIAGAKNIFIRNNKIHHISGTSPQAGIDIEDGYDLNQNIFIEENNFFQNGSYDLVVVNGKKIYIGKNKFTNSLSGGASLAINGGADDIIVKANFFHKAKVILIGNTVFSDNTLYATQMNILGLYSNRPITISDTFFHNSKVVIDNPFAFLVKIDGCRFFNDFDKLNSFSNLQWTLELKNEPQLLTNCTFEGNDVYYSTYTSVNTKGGWIFKNSIFKVGTSLIGRYENCTFFENITTLGVQGTMLDTVELISCKVISTDRNNTLISANNLKSFKMINCHIEKPNGFILKGLKVTEEILLIGNTFKITDDTLRRSIIVFESSFIGNSIIVKNNQISAKFLNQIGIENNTTNNPQIIISDNILTNASIKSTGGEILKDNIIDGVM